LEAEVVNINENMNLLMASLERSLIPFVEYGGSNSNIGSEGESRDNEDLGKES
jgi:hypothetical protein